MPQQAIAASGTSAKLFGVFESGIQTTALLEVDVRHQILIYAQSRLNYPHDIPQILRSLKFDPLLFGPGHVMRPKQPLDLHWELDTHRVGRKQFLANNLADGKLYFDETCGSCHSVSGDMANLARKYDTSTLRDKILRPKLLEDASSWRLERLHDQKTAAARERHQALLENYSADDVQNVIAYLKTPR